MQTDWRVLISLLQKTDQAYGSRQGYNWGIIDYDVYIYIYFFQLQKTQEEHVRCRSDVSMLNTTRLTSCNLFCFNGTSMSVCFFTALRRY